MTMEGLKKGRRKLVESCFLHYGSTLACPLGPPECVNVNLPPFQDEDFLGIGTDGVELSDPLSPSPLGQRMMEDEEGVGTAAAEAEAALMEGFSTGGGGGEMADWDQDV